MPKAYKPILSKNDFYQNSQNTNYQRDQTTGELFLKSGSNVRTIITEQFKTATWVNYESSVTNTNAIVYTIPEGKILVLISIGTQVSFKAATFGESGAIFHSTGGNLIELYGNDTAGTSALSQVFPIPLVLDSLTFFRFISTATTIRATCFFFGYLIDKSEYYPAI